MNALALIGPMEWVVIAVVAVLIFGRRLPDVGRSLGQGLVEFKKGLRGVKDDVDSSVRDAKTLPSEVDKAGRNGHNTQT